MKRYPKRLIEVDLPIRRISAHARREKSIRHGHISTLHIWWARRPLAACRAVVCASLWPDPGDPICPPAFIETAQRLMLFWGREELTKCSAESYPRFNKIGHDDKTLDDPTELRNALLDFIADFANWNNSTVPEYLAVARTLTVAAHDALEGHNAFTLPAAISVHTLNEAVKDAPRPLLVDPFAGGGAIPLEGLRCGADAFASDLNPVAVLLNKVVMEYIPKYGEKLADEVEKWGKWIKEQAEKELAEFYPKDPDGATPIAYLWARTIQCEGPSCGMIIPLMNQRMISKRRGIGVELICGSRKIVTNIRDDLPSSTFGVGTVTNGRVTCPKCGFTMTAERYRERSKDGQLGEMHYCTVLSHADGGRRYRNPSEEDAAALRAVRAWHTNYPSKAVEGSDFTTIPGEPLSSTEPRRLNVLYYGFKTWGSLFNLRQQLAWTTLSEQLHRTFREIAAIEGDEGLAAAVSTVLGLALSNLLQYNCSMSTWLSDGMISVFIQSSSIPMRADYAEANPLMQRLVGGLSYQLDRTNEVLRDFATVFDAVGTTAHASATEQILSDNSVAALVTDPPYYFAIPYAELSDFFYVWIKRFLRPVHPNLLNSDVTPKKDEAIQNLRHSQAVGQKDRKHFEDRMLEALEIGRREVGPSGVAVVVFAHASTEGWESLLNALLQAGWIITGSWPIDTEKEGRMLASRQRALASSVHLVCRPRENQDGVIRTDQIGGWRDLLDELPGRIHDWMPRLAAEGVVGADAIFACLGPALEIFSRYSSVEKASGERVELREYLEQVWAEVARQALNMIFEGADTAGLEEDARLTAMWLWTLRTDAEADVETGEKVERISGYDLEYDAARKIAQGLGCHLEKLSHLVETKGETATLLSAASRARYLFGKEDVNMPKKRGKIAAAQGDLFAALDLPSDEDIGREQAELDRPAAGKTTLDQLHQAMILFGAGRGAALKRFLVDDGVGTNPQLWSLAQSLTALYPPQSEEKRWVDGVLARKKGLGF